MNASVCVVVRSSGERTLDKCLRIVNSQLRGFKATNINVVPFSAAVKRTFEIGIESNQRWTLALDADILLKENALEELVQCAENLSGNFFMIQGRILDKLFCFSRNGGPHLFRTSLLEEAINLIPEQHETIRPEAETVNRMVGKGFHRYKGVEVYGLHDFEQYYMDIFATAFIHAVKFPYLQNYFMKEWLHRESSDKDYQVARLGYTLGLGYRYDSMPPKAEIQDMGKGLLQILEIDEKKELEVCDVDSIMKGFIVSPQGKEIEQKDHNKILRTDRNMKSDISLRWIGKKLERLGKRLQ